MKKVIFSLIMLFILVNSSFAGFTTKVILMGGDYPKGTKVTGTFLGVSGSNGWHAEKGIIELKNKDGKIVKIDLYITRYSDSGCDAYEGMGSDKKFYKAYMYLK